MNDNTRTRIFLEADKLAKEKYGVFYTELPQSTQEVLYNMAKRIVAKKIQGEINSVGGKRHDNASD